MVKLGVYSHCSVDTIRIGGSAHTQAGGPACYCGLAAARLGLEAELFTRFGPDFPREHLVRDGIILKGAESDMPTTRFELDVRGAERDLRLACVCEPVEFVPSDADGIVVSPLFDEISHDTLAKITAGPGFVFLDPQGFLRRADPRGAVFLERTELDLSSVSAIKVGADEIACLAPGPDGMMQLARRGPEHVLYTDGREVSMLVRDRLYGLVLPNKKIHDTTGVGDIFSSTFACIMLRERDSLWAFCFAAGAAQAALDSGQVGLAKIPPRGAVESNASYFYNTVKFRHA